MQTKTMGTCFPLHTLHKLPHPLQKQKHKVENSIFMVPVTAVAVVVTHTIVKIVTPSAI